MFSLKFPDTQNCGDSVECAYLLEDHRGGQCLTFVKEILDTESWAPEFARYPNAIKPNSSEPEVGAAILFSEGAWGHVGIVFAVGIGNLTVMESNGDGLSEKITLEQYSIFDPRIRGYFIKI